MSFTLLKQETWKVVSTLTLGCFQQAASSWLPVGHVSRGSGLTDWRQRSSWWTHPLLQTRERQLGHLCLFAMWDQHTVNKIHILLVRVIQVQFVIIYLTQCLTKFLLCMRLCLTPLHLRPPWGGVRRAVGGAALSSKGPRCGFEPAGGVPPQPVSDCGAETPLDPALHTEPQDRPGALQEVC